MAYSEYMKTTKFYLDKIAKAKEIIQKQGYAIVVTLAKKEAAKNSDLALSRVAIEMDNTLQGVLDVLNKSYKYFSSIEDDSHIEEEEIEKLNNVMKRQSPDVLVKEVNFAYLDYLRDQVVQGRDSLAKQIEKTVILQNIENYLTKAQEKLGDLKYDTKDKNSYAGLIKKYEEKLFKDKRSLVLMKGVFPEVKSNVSKLISKVDSYKKEIKKVSEAELQNLNNAVEFLKGNLKWSSGFEHELKSLDLSYYSNIKVKSNNEVIYNNFKSLNDFAKSLSEYESHMGFIKSKLVSQKSKVRNAFISLAVITGIVLASGAVYHHVVKPIIKDKDSIIANTVDINSGLEDKNDALVIGYKDAIFNEIEKLENDSIANAWNLRVGGEKAIESLQKYVDAKNAINNDEDFTSEDAETKEIYDLLNILSSSQSDVQTITSAYQTSMENLNSIKDSVGILLSQNIEKTIYEQINFNKITSGSRNYIQGVSIDFVENGKGKYDSKMLIEIKSYDLLSQKDIYKYFVIKTEDSLKYLAENKILDTKAVQNIFDNGSVIESGEDYKEKIETEYNLPGEVKHIYLGGVSSAIKKGSYNINYKITLNDGRTIEGDCTVKNLKATDEISVIKSVYKNNLIYVIDDLLETEISESER